MSKTNARHLINFFLIGAAIGLGLKAIDWAVPNQVRRVEVKVERTDCGPDLKTSIGEPGRKSLLW